MIIKRFVFTLSVILFLISTPVAVYSDNITGTNGDDKLKGTSGPDVIRGLAGNDLIEGLEGDDILNGAGRKR